MNISVIGAGAWGTALANLLCQNGHAVSLWAHHPELLESMSKTRLNHRYLPGISLHQELRFEPVLELAVESSEVLVIAVPSKAIREVSSRMGDFKGLSISVVKGIEYDSGLSMGGVLKQTMPRARVAVLSGPSLAMEVARQVPGAIVAANQELADAALVQQLFSRPYLRVYTSTDAIGVELGGALKNVIAIGAGVCDGLGFGDNTKATLITRGVVEMRRLGVACGAQAETFSGLGGLGDLIVTCFSKLSRNRGFGEKLGAGNSVPKILAQAVAVAEGYPTSRSAFKLARRVGVETPIMDEVYQMLYEGKPIGQAIQDLMQRDLKSEDAV